MPSNCVYCYSNDADARQGAQLLVASECTDMLKEQRMKEQECALLKVHLEGLHSVGCHERVGRHRCLL